VFRIVAVAAASMITLTATGSASARAEKTWRPIQVIAGLRHAGIPIGAARYYGPASDPNKLLGRPGQYNGKANFHDRRLQGASFDVDNGGSVETFPDKSSASNRYRYVKAIATSGSLFSEYDYLEGTVLLRVSHELTPAQAKRYERTFRKIV
jgi:hypothetical protein